MKYLATFGLIGLLSLMGPAALAAEATPDATDAASDVYRIGKDDIVQISVWRNPELSVTVPVRPDGRISVPLGGDVMVAGHTPDEVATAIEAKLATFVRDPQVSVILTELRSHEYLSRIRVTGAVRQPISVPYRQGMTVLDAVLAAGGVTEFASADNTKLFRRDKADTLETLPIKLDRLMKKGDLENNLALRPGDIVTVPERAF
ncbi:MAG: XrtA/PEP-CTERM system exopolysaccharide export protein [Dokdonella sp.]